MDWKDIVNYGLPTILLACVVYALVKLATWMRGNVVEPIVKAHVELMEVLKREVPDQGKKLSDVAAGIKEMIRGQTDKVNEVKEVLQAQTHILTQAIEQQTEVLMMGDKKRGPES